MQLTLAHIGPKPSEGFAKLTSGYLERIAVYCPVSAESFRSEAGMVEWLNRQRTRPYLVLLDGGGKVFSSERFAEFIGARRDEGTRQMVFAVGPADGWSRAGLAEARCSVSLGPMTLAHSLARLVIAEQLYRAFTILAGHPYHTGH